MSRKSRCAGRLIFPTHPSSYTHTLTLAGGASAARFPGARAIRSYSQKISGKLQEVQKAAIDSTVRAHRIRGPRVSLDADTERGVKTMEAELDAAGNGAIAALREKQRAMIDALDLSSSSVKSQALFLSLSAAFGVFHFQVAFSSSFMTPLSRVSHCLPLDHF